MPEPLNFPLQLSELALEDAESAQDALFPLGLSQDDEFCACTAQTVLALVRHESRPLCADMPWACPKRHLR